MGGVVIWNHGITVRHFGDIELKPGRNVLTAEQWEKLKNNPRVVQLLAAGAPHGLSMQDIRSDILARLDAGEPVDIVNDLPVSEAVAYVYAETNVARLRELQGKVKYPQVAMALTMRIRELERAATESGGTGRKKSNK